MDYNPWGCKESDAAEQLSLSLSGSSAGHLLRQHPATQQWMGTLNALGPTYGKKA